MLTGSRSIGPRRQHWLEYGWSYSNERNRSRHVYSCLSGRFQGWRAGRTAGRTAVACRLLRRLQAEAHLPGGDEATRPRRLLYRMWGAANWAHVSCTWNDGVAEDCSSPLQFQPAHEIAFSKRRAVVAENVVSCGGMKKEVRQRERHQNAALIRTPPFQVVSWVRKNGFYLPMTFPVAFSGKIWDWTLPTSY